jgi:methyl-accepting chemotaxis protein WspA
VKNWTLSNRVLASFLLVIAAVAAMGGLAYRQLVSIEQQASNLEKRALPQASLSTQLLSAFDENFSIMQELVIQENSAAFEEIRAELDPDEKRMDDLAGQLDAVIDPGEERAQFEAYKSVLEPYRQVQKDVLDLARNLRNPEAQVMLRTRLDPEFDKVHDAIELMVDMHRGDADAAAEAILASVTSAKTGIMISLVVAVLLAFASGYYLLQSVTRPLRWLVGVLDAVRQGDLTQRIERRDEFGKLGGAVNRMADELATLVGQIQDSGIQVGASLAQIAATAKEQQTTASEIAATTSQIGATSKEISATSKELVKTMNEVSGVAEGAAALAGSGQAGLSHMEETMHQVMDAAGSINDKLVVLNEKAGNINQVVTTITKVADQTNLLSLNAAIEAEKAGEYGRGFAAVAAEIRRLADQTAVATYDIEQMVREIQSAVSAGVMGMDKFSEEVRRGMHDVHEVGDQLSQIIHQVQELAPRIEAVNEGMHAQATGAEQISEALLQLTEAAQQTVDSLRQSTLAIDELNKVSGSLRSGVSRFKLAAA